MAADPEPPCQGRNAAIIDRHQAANPPTGRVAFMPSITPSARSARLTDQKTHHQLKNL
jgi:hypothetical protein